MLMSAGYEVPQQLLIHGYLTVREAKMSKSVGNVLDPFRVIERYGLDALRYYLFRDVRFGGDGDVSYERVHDRFNLELANDLGNLLSPHRGDDRGATATASRRPAPSTLAIRAGARALGRRRFAGACRPVRADRGARGGLGERPRAQPLRRGARAVEAREGPGRGRASSTTSSYTLQDGLRVIAVMIAAFIPDARPTRSSRPSAPTAAT